MISVDIKNLLSKLNTYSTNALHNAAGLCVSLTHYEVSVEHYFLKCLEDVNSDLPIIMHQYGVETSRLTASLSDVLEDFKSGNSGKPVFSPMLIELFEDAWLISSVELGDTRIRSGAVLLAFLSKPNFYASGAYSSLLSEVSRDSLIKEFWSITKSSVEYKLPAAERGGSGPAGAAKGDGGFLERFCVDFTAKAKEGGIDPVFGRDAEMRQMVDILARRRKNNPILVGEPGVGKTAVIEGLALRITEGDVPEILSGVSLIGLDMGLLEAGAGMKGEFENRLKGVIDEIKSSEKPIILFIDEAHTLVGAGGSTGGSDAANLLKPALARGELKTCAATTWTEYKKYFEKDPALARRFQLVKLDEPSVETSTIILRGLRDSYEKSHKVIIRDDACVSAAVFSDRYIAGRFLPDKAIDLLDTTCARVKVNLSAKPAQLEDCERTVQALEREKKAVDRDRLNGVAVDESRYREVDEMIASKTKEADQIRERWLKEKDAAHAVLDARQQVQAAGDDKAEVKKLKKELAKADKALARLQVDEALVQIEVSPDLVGRVVSDWTGIPVGKMARDEAKTVVDLDIRLQQRVKGQDQGLAAIAEVIRASKAGIKNPDQPIGVFLIVGPSGVGKTETGLSLADLLFGDERSVVTVNMSEFQEKHTVSRLIGSPPGYVGYGEGGMLTEAVRRQPYSVVLLDEVEKAHLDVMNTFYQVFDKGILTDGEGKDINFKNTIIILTSNLATDVIQEMTGGEDEMPLEAVTSAVRPILSQHFKPALLARMNVVPYVSLNPEAMKLITRLKLGKLEKMLFNNNKMKLSYDEAVVDQIAARCTEVETGARNIEYILNGNVLPQMSKEILGHMTEGGMPSAVHLSVAEDGSFSMEFSRD
ncbi:type VI secretion system ATPase TssH [Maridesulfovibrio hydrothermalis]|uniref:Protein ClpV1 n=1 Tax=Maridesulfovibrio hydrothermalis AM13 = DSM 14728 TaxID=1121451 RepID=L0RBI7_9BACT|nr:type VI secretion system ATPase TssH [Maridesulfovibrio hydrothermalis]CCO24158.1 Protein ClpV1 [Maridesulfovibrio hydrothermalis AM13 = DSM 14728]